MWNGCQCISASLFYHSDVISTLPSDFKTCQIQAVVLDQFNISLSCVITIISKPWFPLSLTRTTTSGIFLSSVCAVIGGNVIFRYISHASCKPAGLVSGFDAGQIYICERVYHSETSSEEIRGMFLQNQEANLAQSVQGSWPTFLVTVELCSNLTPMFALVED